MSGGDDMKKKLPTTCDECGSPLLIRSFRVAVTTPDPKVLEIRMVNVAVCEKCSIAYTLRKEVDPLLDRLVAWEAELDEILFS